RRREDCSGGPARPIRIAASSPKADPIRARAADFVMAAPMRFNQDGSARMEEGGSVQARVRRLPLSRISAGQTQSSDAGRARASFNVSGGRAEARVPAQSPTKSPGAFAPGLSGSTDRDAIRSNG